jgi:hypothetical protein
LLGLEAKVLTKRTLTLLEKVDWRNKVDTS